MRAVLGFTLTVLALGLIVTTQPRAQTKASDGLFVVRNIDVTVRPSSDGRERGFAQAMEAALGALSQRLLRPADQRRLGAADAQTMRASIAIEEEAYGTDVYTARMTVSFDPQAVRNLFLTKGLAWSEMRAPSVFIFPAEMVEGRRVPTVTPGASAWRAAWDKHEAERQGLLDWRLPRLGITPVPEKIRYATLTDGAIVFDPIVPLPHSPGPLRQPLRDGLSLDQAIARFLSAQERDWKQATLIDPQRRSQIRLYVSFQKESDWVKTENALRALPHRIALKIDRITSERAVLVYDYYGDRAQLAWLVSLANLALSDEPDADGFHRLTIVNP